MARPLLILLLAACLAANGQTVIPADANRVAVWQSDLEFLVQRIQSSHPNPYTRTTREQFQAEVQTLRERIPQSSDVQVVLGFVRILALLNDGHSGMSLTQRAFGLRNYSIGYRWFSDGLFVTIAPEASARLIGSRVVSMNGRPIDEVFQSIRSWISCDTEQWCRQQAQTLLGSSDVLLEAGVVDESRSLSLEVENAAGERFSVNLPFGVTTAEGPMYSRPRIPLYRRNTALDYWFEYLPDAGAIYVQYNRCRSNGLLPISTFTQDLLAAIRDYQPRRLVFDLRDNAGGASRWFRELLDTLYAAAQAGEVPVPAAGVVGIIGKRTFSSGTLAAYDLQSAGVPLVGETTGGRVSWFGENPAFTLPGTGLLVSLSTRLVATGLSSEPISPTLEVAFPGAEYFAGRDPYLAAALTFTP